MKILILAFLVLISGVGITSVEHCSSLKGDAKKKCLAEAIAEVSACTEGNCAAIVDQRKPYFSKDHRPASSEKITPSTKVKSE